MWVRTLLLAAVLATSVGAAPASAAPRGQVFQQENFVAIQGHREQRTLSLRDVERILSSQLGGGHVVRADGPRGDPPYYTITWVMPSGDYRELTVDAVTGQIR